MTETDELYQYYGDVISNLRSNRPTGEISHRLSVLSTIADGGKIKKPYRLCFLCEFQRYRNVYNIYQKYYTKFENDIDGAKREYIALSSKYLKGIN